MAPRRKNPASVHVGLSINADLHQRLITLREDEGVPISWLVNKLLSNYFANKNNKKEN